MQMMHKVRNKVIQILHGCLRKLLYAYFSLYLPAIELDDIHIAVCDTRNVI